MRVAFWFVELSFAVANFFHGVVHMNLYDLLVIIVILEELLALFKDKICAWYLCENATFTSCSLRLVLDQIEEPMMVHGLGAQFNKLGMVFFFFFSAKEEQMNTNSNAREISMDF
ncbi:hypothetical protein RHSIM_Rhsim11G0026700 [Rhododendron simsii]|uniref:Uncharacterized protein n=1 Tax=Rhododendron simsii TaxID=118357 RepID=A0A834G6M0_RHOSS|nr:hypothetical protein RHSIM_Rhsim11G0026700 [Rhododendron simsii]